MQLKQSKRKNVKLRLGISGASGFGKTHSALLLAYGIVGFPFFELIINPNI
ncbi:hypothetical protein PL373_15965 [Tenacibaculum maritimum]|nr:hypothetical protein [Tenacibaculum maritimum]